MKVLAVGSMYPPLHLGGYELVWQSVTHHLNDLGWEVRVLTSDYCADDAGLSEENVFRELRWYWRDHEFPRLPHVQRLRLERHNQRVLARHLHELKPDVVSWWAMGGMSMSLITQVAERRIPAIGFVMDEWLLYGPVVDQWQRAATRIGALKGAARAITGIHAPVDLTSSARWSFISETTRRHAEAELGALPGSLVLSPGIELEAFTPQEPKPWGHCLLCAGRLDERKGIHVAVEALSRLPDCSLVIDGAGDETYRERLVSGAAERGLEGRVKFVLSSRSELPDQFSDADAVLFPVLWEEPWGLVPLEAMAVGRPVIATGAGGSGEYLRDGENCLIVPRGDASAIARAVKRLETDSELRETLRKGGFETAAKHSQDTFKSSAARLIAGAAAHG